MKLIYVYPHNIYIYITYLFISVYIYACSSASLYSCMSDRQTNKQQTYLQSDRHIDMHYMQVDRHKDGPTDIQTGTQTD